MIQSSPDQVIITYNKLHAEPKQGFNLDKKIKPCTSCSGDTVPFRQDPGHHTEEGEAQDGGEHEQLHGGCPRPFQVGQRRRLSKDDT